MHHRLYAVKTCGFFSFSSHSDPSYLLDLMCLHDRISLGDRILSRALVIEDAVVLVRVTMDRAKSLVAFALEPGQSNPFLAKAAPIRRPFLGVPRASPFHLGLTTMLRFFFDSRGLTIINRDEGFLDQSRSGIAHQVLRMLQQEFLVAFGAKVVGGGIAEKSAIVCTENRSV